MQCFQTTCHTVYHAVGSADDVLCTAVVVGQIVGLGNVVVFLETVYVLVARAIEGVDVLVIVTDCQNRQLVFFSPLPTRKRRNKPVVFFTDVLVFIYQNIAEACHDTFACFIVTIIVFKVVWKHSGSLPAPFFKLTFAVFSVVAVKAHTQKPHCHTVISHNRNGSSKRADQSEQATLDLLRRQTVESQYNDGGCGNMLHP